MIKALKKQALIKEIDRRREAAVMALDMYNFHQVEYTLYEMKRRYPATFQDINKYVRTVPLTQNIVNQRAQVFNRDPIIKPDTESKAIIDAVAKSFDEARLYLRLKTIDRMAELMGIIGVLPYWNPNNQKVELDLLLPDRLVVETFERYPTTPERVFVRMIESDNINDPRRADIWAIWTKDDYAEAYLKTDYTIDEYIKKPERHGYGRIPIAWFTIYDQLDSFFPEQDNPVIHQNIVTNIQLSNLDLALDYQAFATLATEGYPEQNEMIVGLTRHINIPRDSITGQAGGRVYYINPGTDLRQVWEIINNNIEMTANMMGISTASIKQGSEFSSGYQLKLSMQSVIEHNTNKQGFYREALRDLLILIGDCVRIYSPRINIPADLDYNISFADIQVDTNPLEDEQIFGMRLTQKTTDRAEILMQRNQDMTREEAEARIQEIDAQTPTYGRPAFDDDLFNDEIEEEAEA